MSPSPFNNCWFSWSEFYFSKLGVMQKIKISTLLHFFTDSLSSSFSFVYSQPLFLTLIICILKIQSSYHYSFIMLFLSFVSYLYNLRYCKGFTYFQALSSSVVYLTQGLKSTGKIKSYMQSAFME